MSKALPKPPFFRTNSRRKLYMAVLAASPLLLASVGHAGPRGADVVRGAGDIEHNGRHTNINQHTDRMVIDWDSYNIDADQVVTYLRPGTDSISLNRILSNNGSQIHGQINANGRVVLVNPHGMVFGESAQVNVGGLIPWRRHIKTTSGPSAKKMPAT